MTRVLLITMALVMLTSCGIRRPLMKPSEIPAYEAKQRAKRERMERDLQADEDALKQQQEEQQQKTQPVQ